MPFIIRVAMGFYFRFGELTTVVVTKCGFLYVFLTKNHELPAVVQKKSRTPCGLNGAEALEQRSLAPSRADTGFCARKFWRNNRPTGLDARAWPANSLQAFCPKDPVGSQCATQHFGMPNKVKQEEICTSNVLRALGKSSRERVLGGSSVWCGM